MKRKPEEPQGATRSFGDILQDIKKNLTYYTCPKLIEIEKRAEGFNSTNADDLIEAREELQNLKKNILPLKYYGEELDQHGITITREIQTIDIALSQAEYH